ncbi:pro-Pol polyprotein [Trichonephila clavipes]|nr:pro-Pol polyprotein [Trichonephila clavipes]
MRVKKPNLEEKRDMSAYLITVQRKSSPSNLTGIWEKELKGKNITLTDHGSGCPDIELLIGGDFCGHLFSGNIWTLECGLVTYETKLGWLFIGKVPGLKQEDTFAYLVTSLLLKNNSVADLWKMETLRIMDPVKTKSKEEMETNAVEHFIKTVDRDEEGRYIVKLPWIETKEIVQDNRSAAEQRCIRTSQKLKVEGKYTVYEAVFKEWLNEEEIEKVPKEEIVKSSYYLLHSGFLKKILQPLYVLCLMLLLVSRTSHL